MSFPPVFELAASDSAVTQELGTSPVRLYPFGEAPAGSIKPYCVWQTITGTPEHYLDKVPDANHFRVQIDVYADTAKDSRKAANALISLYEQHAYVMNTGMEMREKNTNLYRINFDVDFITVK